MPKGWDLGVLDGQKINFSKHGHVAGWWVEQNTSKIFTLVSNLWPCGGVKRSNIIKFQLQSQFQRFLYQTLVCVLTNKIYKTYHTEFSFCSLGHAPWVGHGGAGGLGIAMAPHRLHILVLVCHSSSFNTIVIKFYCMTCSNALILDKTKIFTISAEVH